MESKVTVVVPVYNAESTLRRCVESLLNQDFDDYSIFLINDGSTDESAGICDQYAMKYSHVRAFHKSNGGVSSARNYALDRIRGGM